MLYFQECLTIFGTGVHTTLKLCYGGYGTPLILMYTLSIDHEVYLYKLVILQQTT